MAALNVNFENQVNLNLAIQQLQAELNARDTEMTAADVNDAEDTRKPHVTTGTSPCLSYANVIDAVPSFVESTTRAADIVATCHELHVVITNSESVNVMSAAPHSFEGHVAVVAVDQSAFI